MESLKTLYKIGYGPSSSHTLGPAYAAAYFKDKYEDADEFKVILYGSLALTGIGHGTDKAIKSVMKGVTIFCDITTTDLPHPNTMDFIALKNGQELGKLRILSIGGGEIQVEGEEVKKKEVYEEKSFDEILKRCIEKAYSLYDYVLECEGIEIVEYLKLVWSTMKSCVEEGLFLEGMLPGPLEIERKAKRLFNMCIENETPDVFQDRIISSYAFAVAEQNACSKTIVTAPTCGSSGVMPAVLYYMEKNMGCKEEDIIKALAVAGVIGNVIRTNASISGAEAGCQAEIGSACSMASAALASLNNFSLQQIEYSAEVAMEHSLGLTCDPVGGYVQIPCIERNAVAAMRALNCVSISRFLADTRKISFDSVVETMYRTGKDISPLYRETGNGGLAKLYE